MLNVEQTIISQYGNSSTIGQLIYSMNECIDPRADIDAFYNYVFNVDTAQGYGLDILGRIVNVKRSLLVPPPFDNFGFNEAGSSARPFNESPFWDGIPPQSEVYNLTDNAYRQLILIKAISNISACDAKSINNLLKNMFRDRGRCYVNDLGSMSIRYTFEFALTVYEFAIITQSGALPIPAGVSASMINVDLPVFGFSEAGSSASPFGEGTFIYQGAINAIN